jgi:hypothetical protein
MEVIKLDRELNQAVKGDFEEWCRDLQALSAEYDQKLEQLENEIKILRARQRVLNKTALTLQEAQRVDASYIVAEKSSVTADIKSKETELVNLQDGEEWKKIYQVRRLIDDITKEIKQIEASE